MLTKLRLSFIAMILPTIALASSPKCVEYDFLSGGLDVTAFKNCEVELQKCPKEHSLPDMACINKAVEATADCKQLSKLSTKTHGVLGMITADSVGNNFVILTQHYPADGQENYFIVSPAGCLAKTTIDPRTVDNKLKKEYKKVDFFVRAAGKPTFENVDEVQRFTTPLTITKSCAACEVIGKANIEFDFSKEGSLLKSRVASFDTAKKEE